MRGTEKVERGTQGGSKCGRAKAGFFLWSYCGLTEVMPFYKARFDESLQLPETFAAMKTQMRCPEILERMSVFRGIPRLSAIGGKC